MAWIMRLTLIPVFGFILALASAWYIPSVVETIWDSNAQALSAVVTYFHGDRRLMIMAKAMGAEKMALMAQFDLVVGLVWYILSMIRIK